jgi:hypothetical protein
VLFIGNSLTYTNDIPGIVQAFADSAAGEGIGIGLPPAVPLRTGDLIALDPGVVATLQQAAAEALAAASTATASGVVVSLPLPAGASQ